MQRIADSYFSGKSARKFRLPKWLESDVELHLKVCGSIGITIVSPYGVFPTVMVTLLLRVLIGEVSRTDRRIRLCTSVCFAMRKIESRLIRKGLICRCEDS